MSGLIEEDAWMNGRTKRAGNEGGKERLKTNKIVDQNILMRTTNMLVKCANTSMNHYNFNDCASIECF